MGTKTMVNKQQGATTIMGDDPKKYAAAVVEYSKDGHKVSEKDMPNKFNAICAHVIQICYCESFRKFLYFS